MTQIGITEILYTALKSGAAVQPRPDDGVLALADADRVDFLQRITTNNVAALRPGASLVTVLTSPTARVLFVFTVVMRADELWLLPAAGEAAALERHLRGQIFFMDRVQVRARADLARLRVLGPQAVDVVRRALGVDLSAASEGAWQAAGDVLALKQEVYDLPGIELIAPTGEFGAVQAGLAGAGALLLDGDAGAAAYTARRVELGRPLPGAELTGEYNPLEAGLAWACSESKGCYTGQEIIARQISYDKVTRMLVGLRAAHPLAAGTPLTAEGRAVGVVTSATEHPEAGGTLGLAIVKRPHHAPGTWLDAGGQPVEVAALPLVQQ